MSEIFQENQNGSIAMDLEGKDFDISKENFSDLVASDAALQNSTRPKILKKEEISYKTAVTGSLVISKVVYFLYPATEEDILTKIQERDAGEPGSLFPAFGNTPASARPAAIQSGQGMVSRQTFHGQPTSSATMAQLPAARPRARARRGQATDPHSIAERLRRERIAEKIKQLQELVPNCNKTDRAAMLDEIMDYVKFLRLQVNVLSMSRLGGTGSVAQLASGVPCPTVEGDENGGNQEPQVWDKWLGDGTEQHVAKLMREDVGAAMQFLQSKSLCLLPISLAMAIYSTHPPEDAPDGTIKSEPNTHTS